MKHIQLLLRVVFLGGVIAFPLASCQGNAPAPTSAPSVSEGDLESKGIVESADKRLSVIGKGQLLVSLRNLTNPPTAPNGWEFVGPAFEVSAQDRQRRPVQRLAAALKLRFDVPLNRPVTVMVHDGKVWEIVPSDVDAEGKLVADVDHLTPYAAAAPQGNVARGAPTAPKITPGARATVAVAPASSSDAQAALESAATTVKGKKVKVTSAAGYTGSLYVAIPESMRASLDAVNASGTAYAGLYNAVNEAFTAQAKGGSSSGALTLLVEPKTTFPANATDARSALASSFAGIPVSTLTQTRADSTAYVFYGTSGNTAYSVGYASYNGVPLAYAMTGSGTYQSLVPKQ